MGKSPIFLMLVLGAAVQAWAGTKEAVQTTHKTYMVFKADLKWGAGGSGDGMFLNARGLCLDPSGNVYVLDNGNNRVQKFDADGGYIASYRRFEQPDGDPEAFKVADMKSVCVDNDGNIFFRGSIEDFFYDKDRKLVFRSGAYAYDAAGFFLGRDGYLYVLYADGGVANIVRRTRGGKLVVEYPDKAGDPSGIAVDSRGNIYALNNGYGNDCAVQKYARNGDYVLRWGKRGERDGEFGEITAGAVDGEDHLYVLDGSRARIQAFTPDGKLWAKWGRQGIGLGEMRYPRAVAVNSRGQVYVLDAGNNRVQRFTRYRVGVTLDRDGNVLRKTEEPLTDTLPNTQVSYAPGSDERAYRDEAAPRAVDPQTREELKARGNGGIVGAAGEKGRDAVENAAGDAAKKLLGF